MQDLRALARAARRTLFLPGFALLAATPRPSPADRPLEFQKPRFTREQIETALLSSGERWWLVYGTRDPAAAPVLRERAMVLSRRLFGGDTTSVVADRAASAELIAQRSLILIGDPGVNDWTAMLGAALPVQFTHAGFRWHDREYARPGDVIHLVYPHPLEPHRMLVLIAGNSIASMAQRGGGILASSEDWRIYRDGELTRSGSFAHGAGSPWRYDASIDRDRERERAQFAGSLARTTGRGVIVSAPRGVDPTRTLLSAEAIVQKLAAVGVTRTPARDPVSLVLSRSSRALLTQSVFETAGCGGRAALARLLASDSPAHSATPLDDRKA